MYGLALVLIISVGITIACEEDEYRQTELRDLYGVILGKYIPETARNATKGIPKLNKNASVAEIDNSNRDYALICPYSDELFTRSEAYKVYVFDDYQELKGWIELIMNKIKKLVINYYNGMRQEVISVLPMILDASANQLEELHISCEERTDFGVWNLLSDNKGRIMCFPSLTKFQFCGNLTRNNFKNIIPKIFPRVKCFEIIGMLKDPNCLNLLREMKELLLFTDSITDDKLGSIFAKNQNLQTFGISAKEPTTIELVASRLMNLKIFRLQISDQSVLIPPKTAYKNQHRFPNVKHFVVSFYGMEASVDVVPFDMPILETLTLNGYQFDNKTIAFVNHFKNNRRIKSILIETNDQVKVEEIRAHLDESTWPLKDDVREGVYLHSYLYFERSQASSSQSAQ